MIVIAVTRLGVYEGISCLTGHVNESLMTVIVVMTAIVFVTVVSPLEFCYCPVVFSTGVFPLELRYRPIVFGTGVSLP